MFDWIREIAIALKDHLTPFVIVYEYERAAVFRFGKYHRTIEPGFNWRWPLVESYLSEHTVVTTLALEPQSVTTKDEKSVVVQGIVRYRIADVKLFLTEISNQHDVLRDTAMGAVLKQVRLVEFRPLLDEPPESKIAADIRRQVKPFGIEVELFTFTDAANMKTLRLITHTHAPAPEHFYE
jgi:regulator of protease activity HflC (stomatin/prohibitin superfamily)